MGVRHDHRKEDGGLVSMSSEHVGFVPFRLFGARARITSRLFYEALDIRRSGVACFALKRVAEFVYRRTVPRCGAVSGRTDRRIRAQLLALCNRSYI